MKKHLCVAICLLICGHTAGSDDSINRSSEPDARKSAISAARSMWNLPPDGFVHVLRREDVEERFAAAAFDLRFGKGPPPPFLYQVRREGWQIEDSGVSLHASSPPAEPAYVAVSRRTGRTYWLPAGATFLAQWNRLAEDEPLRIYTTNNAIEYVGLIAEIGLAQGTRFAANKFELKHAAESLFVARAPSESAGERQFAQWWRTFDREVRGASLEPSAKPEKGGYLVTLIRVAFQQGVPIVERWTLRLSAEGQCEMNGVTRIFPRRTPH